VTDLDLRGQLEGAVRFESHKETSEEGKILEKKNKPSLSTFTHHLEGREVSGGNKGPDWRRNVLQI